MVELLVGILILSFGIIPIYHIFTSSRKTVFRSELSYLALHAAREKIEELRCLPPRVLMQLPPVGPWERVEGNALEKLARALPRSVWQRRDLGHPTDFGDPVYRYPDDYRRIQLRVSIKRPDRRRDRPPYLFHVRVQVRWQEKGEDVTREEYDRRKTFMGRFDTMISVGAGHVEETHRA